MQARRCTGALLTALAVAGASTGCSSAGASAADISVVASTDVYGAIAEELAAGLPARRVSVTSIIADPAVDPHSYEANPRDELAISRADLILENGGGYDDFVDDLRKASGASARVINAIAVSGRAGEQPLNEHVWYDVATTRTVAARISQFLIAHDPSDAAVLRRNARSFSSALGRLQRIEANIRRKHAGAGAAVTEPVPLYLLEACGLVNRTPAEFSAAVENGTDASPQVLQALLDLFSEHRVQLLAYNEQTSDTQTDQVVAAAKANAVAVVTVTESLPADIAFPAWLGGILRAVEAALS
jgi:zinc/manganese transport system substrate-binding protein